MQIIKRPSPNFNERKNKAKIEMVVIHFTGMKSAEDALNKLTDKNDKNPVSCHYLIDEKGKIYQLVAEEKRAWHAGVSKWREFDDVNSASIGIELYNDGKSEFPDIQMQALEKLLQDVIKRNKIDKCNIVGHSDIAPHRKRDPGEKFNWNRLAELGLALKDEPQLKDRFNAAAIAEDEIALKKLFNEAGYRFSYSKNRFNNFKNKASMKEMIIAFQRRWQPEIFTRQSYKIGRADASTVKKLRSVIRASKKCK